MLELQINIIIVTIIQVHWGATLGCGRYVPTKQQFRNIIALYVLMLQRM